MLLIDSALRAHFLQESIKTSFERLTKSNVVFFVFFFSNSVYHKLPDCYDGLGLVWSGDKCVSFRGGSIKPGASGGRDEWLAVGETGLSVIGDEMRSR